jgi:hypothetical protein
MAAMMMMMMIETIASQAACSGTDHQTSRVLDRLAFGDSRSVG